MKQLLSLLFAVLVATTAFAQTSPSNKLRSNDSFTQVDNYLVAAKRLGIPSGTTPTLDATVSPENSTKLFYDTDDQTLMVYDPVNEVWSAVSVDLTNYYTKSQVDSAITAIDLSGYVPISGNMSNPMTGTLNLGNNEITNASSIRAGISNTHRTVVVPASILMENNNNGLHIISAQSAGPLLFQTPTAVGSTTSSGKFQLLTGDNQPNPSLKVADFFGSVYGKMSGTGDPNYFAGQYATQPYVTSQLGNYIPITGGTASGPLGSQVGLGVMESSSNGPYVLNAGFGGTAFGYYDEAGHLEVQDALSFVDPQYRLKVRHSSNIAKGPLFEIFSKATYNDEYTLTDRKDLTHKGYVDDLPGFGLSRNATTGKFDFGTATSLGSGFMRTISVPSEDIVSIGNPLGPEPRIYVNNTTSGQNVSMRVGSSAAPVGVDVSASAITVGSIGGTSGITVNPTTGVAEYRASVNLGSASARALVDKAYVGKMFSYTTSGGGPSVTSFIIPHGLDYTPTMVIATGNSEDTITGDVNSGSSTSGGFRAYVSGANVIIDYQNNLGSAEGPVAGTNNLTWTILVK